MPQRLTARSVSHFRSQEFRNGYFYRYALMAGTRVTADGRKIDVPDTTPIHTEYLLFAAENGIIEQSLLDSVKPAA